MASRDNSQRTTKPVRLFKALREFNVSVDTLVDTLKEAGLELDAKLEKGDIDAKLPPEMYDALRAVFAEDMDARARVSALRSYLYRGKVAERTGGSLGYTSEIQGKVISLADLEDYENRVAPDEPEDKDELLTQMYERSMTEVAEGEIVTGRVASIGEKEIVIDIGFESDGIVSKNEFDREYEIGEEIDVFLERLEDRYGQLMLSKTKADDVRRWQKIEDAFENEGIIEGTIIRRIKGSMIVDLLGAEAFLPGSQIDVRPVRDFDAYLGKTMGFMITKINVANGNVVVSHKALIEKGLEEQREKGLEEQREKDLDIDVASLRHSLSIKALDQDKASKPEATRRLRPRPDSAVFSGPSAATPSNDASPASFFIRLTTSAADRIITLLDPHSDRERVTDAAWSDRDEDTRLHAVALLRDAYGRSPTAFVSRRSDVDRETGWELLSMRLPGEGGVGVSLLLARKPDCLLVIGARRSRAGVYAHEVEITPRIHYECSSRPPLPPDLLDRLAELPTREERSDEVDYRLGRWMAYLDVEERAAKAKQFRVPFTARRHGEDPTRLHITLGEVSPDDLELVARCRDRVRLVEPGLDGEDDNTIAQAEIKRLDRRKRILVVDLDEDAADAVIAGHLTIPAEGLVVNDAWGSLTMIRRQKKAIDRLKLTGGALPDLDRLLFGGNDDLVLPPFGHVEPVPLEECLDQDRINERQRLAVALAMNTPDCFFLQGPPGTGKTTFIAELCYQLARQGKRVLVASQANLAVDNALSRLQLSRDILAVRLGPSDRVDDEAADFVGERAVRRWLRSVVDHGRNRIEKLERRRDRHAWFKAHGGALAASVRESVRLHAEIERQQGEAERLAREATAGERAVETTRQRSERLSELAAALSTDSLRSAEPPAGVAEAWAESLSRKAREAWRASTRLARLAEGSGADDPWTLGARLRQRANELSAAPALEPVADAAMAALESECGDVSEAEEALGRRHEEAMRDLRDAERRFAQAEAELGRARATQRDSDAEAKRLKDALNNPVLDPGWLKRLAPDSATARLAERLRTADAIALLPGDADPVPHHDPPSLVDAWVRYEHAARWDEAERVLDALAGAVSHLSARASYPLVGRLFQGPLTDLIGHLRRAMQQLAASLGRPITRSTPAEDAVLLERSPHLWKLEASRKDAAKVAARAEAALEEASATKSAADAALASVVEDARALCMGLSGVLERLEEEHGSGLGRPGALGQLATKALVSPTKAYESARTTISGAVRERRSLIQRIEQAIATADEAKRAAAQAAIGEAAAAEEEAEEVSRETRRQRAAAERAREAVAACEQRIAAAGAVWEEALHAGAVGPDTPRTPEAVKVERADASADAADPARLAAEIQLVRDWIERVEAGGDVGKELAQQFRKRANVVGATCAHAGKRQFYEEFPEFDVVVVDEVSKATPTELLLPCLLGRKVILVGDHRQLAPVFGLEGSFAEAAEQLGLTADSLQSELQESLFKERYEYFAGPGAPMGDGAPVDDGAPVGDGAARALMLNTQYRMHSHIMEGVNQFYDEQLRLGEVLVDGTHTRLDEVRDHGLDLPWVSPAEHIVWIDTPLGNEWGHTQDGPTRYNDREIDLVARIVADLDRHAAERPHGPRLDVGVTSVYAAQVKRIRGALANEPLSPTTRAGLRISTVDRFQGMERDVMVLSLVLNRPQLLPSVWLRTPERINVAMSRSRRLLVIVGSAHNYCEVSGMSPTYARFFDIARSYGRVVDAHTLLP